MPSLGNGELGLASSADPELELDVKLQQVKLKASQGRDHQGKGSKGSISVYLFAMCQSMFTSLARLPKVHTSVARFGI